MDVKAPIVVALLSTALLAGCLGASPTGSGSTGGDGPGTAPSGPAGGDGSPLARPHVHDRWDGQTRRTVFDETVSTRTTADVDPDQDLVDNAFCVAFNCGAGVTFTPDEIVPPGTDELTVEATWDPGPASTTEVLFGYRAANMSGVRVEGTYAGGSMTTEINVTVEMADGGHAPASLWMLGFLAVRRAETPVAAQAVPRHDVRPLEIDVTVTAHRIEGDLPREPEHPDWWADGPRTVWAANGTGTYATVNDVIFPGQGDPPGRFLNGTEHGVVPTGTRNLVFEFTWSNDAPTTAATGTRPYLRWINTFTFDDDMQPLDPEVLSSNRAVFVLPLTAEMVDGMYANQSRWRFLWFLKGDQLAEDDPINGGRLALPHLMDGSWSATFTAYNTTELPDGVLDG